MKLLSVASMLFLVFSLSSAMAENSVDLPEYDLPEYSKVYDDQRSPFVDSVAALTLAKATNRQVLIEIGGNWCSWCHKMDTFLTNNPDVYRTLHSNFVLLKINVSDSNENADFMAALPPVLGYPHMYVSNANGKMLLSKDTAELLAGSEYSREYWLTFLNEWSKGKNQKSEITFTTDTLSEEILTPQNSEDE